MPVDPEPSAMTVSETHLIWIDLEMTGLDPDNDLIIEIATVVTDKHLVVLAEGPVIAIHQSDQILDGMDEWNSTQHASSGLIERVKASSVEESEAEQQTLQFLRQYTDPGHSPMCGNSICQDRRFLARYMPKLEAYLHYRNLDVSSIKELVNRWSPNIASGFKKGSTHLALDDTRDSIRELVYYREYFFK